MITGVLDTTIRNFVHIDNKIVYREIGVLVTKTTPSLTTILHNTTDQKLHQLHAILPLFSALNSALVPDIMLNK